MSPRNLMINFVKQISLWGFFLTMACSSSKPTQKPLALGPVDDSGNSDGKGDEEDSESDEKTISKSSKEDVGPEPQTTPLEGAQLFQGSIHPMMVKWCKSCHASGSQPPYIADTSSQTAYQEITVKHLVDFKEPNKSRIYLRIAQENHNCPPDPGCSQASQSLLEKLEEWVKVEEKLSAKSANDSNPATTTAPKNLAEKTSSRKDSGIPSGSFYFPAESAMIKAPFIVKDRSDGEGGKTVTTAAGAVDQTNLNTATNDATLGTLQFSLDIKTAGVYHVVGRVLSPNANAANNSSFYVKFDTNPLQLWDFPGTNNNFLYDKADAVAATGAPLTFNLTAGTHTLEIRQRQAGVEIDSVIVTSNLTYDFSLFATAERNFDRLEFDFSTQSGIQGAKLALDIADYDAKSYLIKNPELILPQGSGSLKLKNLKVLINDRFLPQHATFTSLQETIAAPGKILSSATMIAIKDKGPAEDKFSLTFETIEKAP